MKLGMVSLGCPKNLVDSEVMLGLIREKNFTVTNDPADAEIIIVNTCGFIESAKEESINTILQMSEYKTQGSCRYLIVTGCLSQRYADELAQSIPEVDAFVGTECFTDISWVIEQVIDGKKVLHMTRNTTEQPVEMPRMLTTPEYMAYLKIAEGCDNCCSYCIIPKLRGPYTSRPYEAVMAEAKELAASGIKEIIVVAQDTTRYGEDLYGKLMLPQLLKDLNDLEGIEWIRVMYCYPNNFTDELIEAFATLPKVCKYVDLPLQHASNSLLASMNRYDTKEQVEALLKKLRTSIPGIVIRTTFIVGFPGESEADFEELKEFVRKVRFDRMGAFAYSEEEGTYAAESYEDSIPQEVKQARLDELMDIQQGISAELSAEKIGKQMKIIIDRLEGDYYIGRTEFDSPEVDPEVLIEQGKQKLLIGNFYQVEIINSDDFDLFGRVI